MKVAIMQPYFFPYIGYFQLINAVDKFILLDTVQFIRHGWIERNRILKQDNSWLYIKVPLKKHSRNTLIKDVEIRNVENWKAKILAQLCIYKKIAPNYSEISKLINNIFSREFHSISEFNFFALKKVCKYLEIKTPISVFSTMNLNIDEVKNADDWALNITKALNAEEYLNPIGGKNIFSIEKYKKNNIQLNFLKTKEIQYSQKRNSFEASLSIIDVLMFNKSEIIKNYLGEKYIY